MFESYPQLRARLASEPHTWLITGVAGFIGSNLLEALLKLNQKVVGLDNFATGYQRNLDEIRSLVTPAQWENFRFLQGDIRNLDDCRSAMRFSPAPATRHDKTGNETSAESTASFPVEYVLHNAALGSVPRSVENPIATNETNISGFLNMLVAARDAKVKRFVFAASSSTYGDHPGLPKVESIIGKPLSPYAVTKYVNELYADVFFRTYGMETIGLRYFNVFGPRQNPNGAYAAVIPTWITHMLKGEAVFINGDGETSRDFCFIENVLQINLLAAITGNKDTIGQVFNVAVGDRTTLNQLYEQLYLNLLSINPQLKGMAPIYRDFRAGDVRHSLADIGKASALLGYRPSHRVGDGLKLAMEWYVRHLA